MHELTIRLRIVRPETGMVEAVLRVPVLTVVGWDAGISLLAVGRVVWTGRILLWGIVGRSKIALWVLIKSLRCRLR